MDSETWPDFLRRCNRDAEKHMLDAGVLRLHARFLQTAWRWAQKVACATTAFFGPLRSLVFDRGDAWWHRLQLESPVRADLWRQRRQGPFSRWEQAFSGEEALGKDWDLQFRRGAPRMTCQAWMETTGRNMGCMVAPRTRLVQATPPSDLGVSVDPS